MKVTFIPFIIGALGTVIKLAQLAGAVEYNNCTSAEVVKLPLRTVLDMTLNNLMMRF